MNLLVGFYQDEDPARLAEFVECVRRNCENPHLDQIVVFIEYDATAHDLIACWPLFAHVKIRLVEHKRRVTFSFLFEYANRHLADSAVIIANADIFFDETLRLLYDKPLAGTMLCLSRWDESPDGAPRHFDNPYSQDAWIFETPIPKIAADFRLGVPGCDNRMAYQAERAGLAVSNPSRSVRARHLHHSAVKRYTEEDRLPGPHRFVPASFLDETASISPRPSEVHFPSHRGRSVETQVDARHREIVQALAPMLGGVVPRNLRRELYRAVYQQIYASARQNEAPLATVACRESMGYTLAKLALGISTHNNDARPLVSVPETLRGLCFTQVVANHAAPVEIEFRSEGKLFVLAAPGWEGYAAAAAFLDDAGWRETIDVLRTRDGTTFEAWSLVAGAGEHLVIPTQVMLAANEVIQLG
jgi:hypothetical protein